MRRRAGLTAVVLMMLGAAANLSAQTTGPQVRFGMYLQVETELSSLGTAANGRVVTTLNRARPRVEIDFNDWISARFEPDFGGGRTRVRYAYVDFAAGDATTIRVGQYKKPFSLIQTTSSSVIPVIHRGVRISGLSDRVEGRGDPLSLPDGDAVFGDEQALLDTYGYQSYAIGAGIEGTAGALEYELGIFDSPIGDPGSGGRGGAAGRLTFTVAPRVRIGTGVSHSRTRIDGDGYNGTAGSLEFGWSDAGRAGPGIYAEGVLGGGVGTDADFAGAQLIAWYHQAIEGRFVGVEPVLRASWGDPDTDAADDGGVLLTAGLNFYLGGRNRLMINWDVYAAQDDRVGTEGALRAQAQVRF